MYQYIVSIVHLACPYECVSRKVEPGTSGLSALAWDDAEVFRACGSSVMAYDDAFTLMKVLHIHISIYVVTILLQ